MHRQQVQAASFWEGHRSTHNGGVQAEQGFRGGAQEQAVFVER